MVTESRPSGLITTSKRPLFQSVDPLHHSILALAQSSIISTNPFHYNLFTYESNPIPTVLHYTHMLTTYPLIENKTIS